MLKTVSCAVVIACAFSALPAMAACPDYVTPANPPALSGPARKAFSNFGNTILAGLYKPWHMAHDVIVKAGQPATITGKFDYDAVLHKDLEGERVHAYLYGSGMQQWQYLGSSITDSDGKVNVGLGVRPVGDYVVRFVVEGDLSSTNGYLSVVDPRRDAVLFDIDGTLTINDFEAYADYVGVKTATAYSYAPQVVNAYRQKGYQVLFLTARPYWVTKDGLEWLKIQNMGQWHYHSNPYGDGPIPPNTQQFKTDYVRYLRNTVGLNIVRAYGNATTDIAAYADGGIPKAQTYIIGPNAGASGTQAIQGDYTAHYSFVVEPTPVAACRL
ncbi:lipin/Ned1/Smp2 family protein [Pseudoduganella sp. HUAS MS19]